jgi:hypothetical protein
VDLQLNLDSETVNHTHPTDAFVVESPISSRALPEISRDQKQSAVLDCASKQSPKEALYNSLSKPIITDGERFSCEKRFHVHYDAAR